MDDLNLAIEKVVSFPSDAIEREQSRHRLRLVVKHLGGGGAMYCVLIGLKRKGNGEDAISRFLASGDALDSRALDSQRASKLKTDLARIGSDPHVSPSLREKVRQLAENLEKLKALYAADKKSTPAGSDPLPGAKSTHRKLLLERLQGHRPRCSKPDPGRSESQLGREREEGALKQVFLNSQMLQRQVSVDE